MAKTPTGEDIVHLFGPINDQVVVDILDVGATYKELEEVALQLAQEDDVLGDMRLPLTGAAARVYDILMSVEDFREDRERGQLPSE